MKTQRDELFDALFVEAQSDPDIILVTADCGAPSLDKWSDQLPKQFLQVGIAEQAAVNIATGLAMSGKRVIVYAIASFLTARAYEQIRNAAMQGAHLLLAGVGAGFSYDHGGPTHWALDDIGIMRCIPGMKIHTFACNWQVRSFAGRHDKWNALRYLRLDRQGCDCVPPVYYEQDRFGTILAGRKFRCYEPENPTIVVAGYLYHEVTKAIGGKKISVIPLEIGPCSHVPMLLIEEHYRSGGLAESMGLDIDRSISVPMDWITHYHCGTRQEIWRSLGMDAEGIRERIDVA